MNYTVFTVPILAVLSSPILTETATQVIGGSQNTSGQQQIQYKGECDDVPWFSIGLPACSL